MISLGRRYYAVSHDTRIEWDLARLSYADFEVEPDWRCWWCAVPHLPGMEVWHANTPRQQLCCSPVCALHATDRMTRETSAVPRDLPEQLIEIAPHCEVCDDEAIDMVVLDNGDRFPYCEDHHDDVLAITQEAGACYRKLSV